MPIIFISLFKTHLYLANSESREYENVENTIDVQPEVIFISPTTIPLSQIIMVNSLPPNTT